MNESNQLIYNLSASSEVEGFEVIHKSFFISDKSVMGQDDADYNTITFNLKPNWS